MDLDKVQEYIGYSYKNEELLKTALTHSSYGNEKKIKNNERLEFLGDSVLSILVSDYIYKMLSDGDEGKLSKIRASLVCEQSLAEIAKRINLGELIFLGRGEEITGGRCRPSVVSDAFEAVLASIYLDGGIEVAKKWLFGLIKEDVDCALGGKVISDYKTLLQEHVQKKGKTHYVTYKTVSETGQDHNKTFRVAVMIDDKLFDYGEGSSKKEAEQQAACSALKKIR